MNEDPPIVADTRRVRSSISEAFQHDLRRYADYLRKKKAPTTPEAKPAVREDSAEYNPRDEGR